MSVVRVNDCSDAAIEYVSVCSGTGKKKLRTVKGWPELGSKVLSGDIIRDEGFGGGRRARHRSGGLIGKELMCSGNLRRTCLEAWQISCEDAADEDRNRPALVQNAGQPQPGDSDPVYEPSETAVAVRKMRELMRDDGLQLLRR